MTVTFYKVTDDPKKIDKDISTVVGSKAAHPLDPTAIVDLLNPTIVIDYDSNLLAANYCYIDTFDRYYWCSFGVNTAGRTVVECKIDYLKSFAASIKACKATIVRAELSSPTYVPDNELPIDPNRIWIEGHDLKGGETLFPDGYRPYLLITNS